MNIEILQPDEFDIWDRYVMEHPCSTLYHLSGWKKVIEKAYGHKTYYLKALDKYNHRSKTNLRVGNKDLRNKNFVGILPLVHLNHFLFGNSLISMPFFDKHIKNEISPLLDGPSPDYPEIEFQSHIP